ncbi:S-layer homology domain-containing protein [Paenibacillus sinopodophylli]|uniref:S-layer homology domain-containing protein n=1 Tax=Paenibacillus sinopodophylli TaxID=1837342 RepID=UPI00110CBE73|nr:S-layer homology domain-containing protein [Paenibacillus sinopodophylli]
MKKMKLTILTMLVAVLFTAQSVAAAAFTDTKTHWAKSDIDTAVSQGWINGYTATSFKPNDNITRAEFTKSLVAAMKYKLEDLDTPFTDDTGWFRASISTGLKQSIIKVADYKDSQFEPNRKITREEIARMTVRALGKDAEGVKSGYLAIAKQNGIMKGYPDGTMGGDKNATRAEAVVMIANTLKAKNPQVKPVAYPKTDKELDTLIHSLPSFKGNTTISRGAVGVNLKGTDNFDDNNVWLEYDASKKTTYLNIFDANSDVKALVKDILKSYYPKSYDKAYAAYVKVDGLKAKDKDSDFETTLDGRSLVIYKASDNIGVVIWIGG